MEIKDCIDLNTAIKYVSEKTGFMEWLNESENDAVTLYHHTVGQSIRNDLNLWDPTSVMNIYFNKNGIYHPDDMSSIILLSAHRRYNFKDIKLQEQINKYIEFWDKVNPNVNKGIFE